MKRLIVPLALLLIAFSGYAQDKWAGTAVSLRATDKQGAPLTLPALVWTPSAPFKGGVVLIHGSNGWSEEREGHYGKALSKAGYLVIAVDSFTPRGVASTAHHQGAVSPLEMASDAFAAQEELITRGVVAARTAVAGFSLGGVAALMIADHTFLPDRKADFPISVPFYPGCVLHPKSPRPKSAVLMLLGEKDDWTGTESCQRLAKSYQDAGGKIEVKIYPGASHGFDGKPEHTGLFRVRLAETYVECRAEIADDGSVEYAGKSFAFPRDEREILAAMQKTCTRRGASVWTNQRQKAAATSDLVAFLDKWFGVLP